MDYSSQNYGGCPGGRMPRPASGGNASFRSVCPAPGCGGRSDSRGDGRSSGRSGGMSCRPRPDWSEFPIGMAYVPWQSFRNLYSYEKAFCVGSLFQELDQPFMIGRCAGR